MKKKITLVFAVLLSVAAFAQELRFTKNFRCDTGIHVPIMWPIEFKVDKANNMYLMVRTDIVNAPYDNLVFGADTFRHHNMYHFLKMDSMGNELWGLDVSKHYINFFIDDDQNVYLHGRQYNFQQYNDTVVTDYKHTGSTALLNPYYNSTYYGDNNFLVKLDPNGNVLWSKFYNGGGWAIAFASCTAPNGTSYGYLGTYPGTVFKINSVPVPNIVYPSSGHSLAEAHNFLKIDKNGNVSVTHPSITPTRQINFESIAFESDNSLHYKAVITDSVTLNGNYVPNCRPSNTSFPVYVVGQLDTNGNILSHMVTSSSAPEDWQIDPHGNQFAITYNQFFYPRRHFIHGSNFLAKYNANGDSLWLKYPVPFQYWNPAYVKLLGFASNTDIYVAINSTSNSTFNGDTINYRGATYRLSPTGKITKWKKTGTMDSFRFRVGNSNKFFVCEESAHSYNPNRSKIRILAYTDTSTNDFSPYIASINRPTCSNPSSGSITVGVNGGTPPYSYNWNTTPPTNTPTITNKGIGNYMCTVTDAAGHVDSLSAALFMPPQPYTALYFPDLQDTTAQQCYEWDTVMVQTSPYSNATFQWFFNQSPISGANTPSYRITTTGNYYVIITDTITGCSTMSDSFDVEFSASPYFSIFPDSANQGVYWGYNQSVGNNLSYVWYFGDGDTSTLQYPTHTYSQPGQYFVCLKVTSGSCSSTYCDSSFLVFKTEGGLMSQLNIIDPNAPPTSVNSESVVYDIAVIPNPATHQLNINLGSLQAEQVSIYNVDGKLVSSVKQPANNSLDISSLANGVYIAEVTPKSPKGDLNTNAVQRVRWVKM